MAKPSEATNRFASRLVLDDRVRDVVAFIDGVLIFRLNGGRLFSNPRPERKPS
jgi:hypothetical protein